MPFRTWREACKVLAEATAAATQKQQELGEILGKRIPPDVPRVVAAAILRVALAEELNLQPQPVSYFSESRLKILHRKDLPISPQNEDEAAAWISYLRLLGRLECLLELKLCEGDIVETYDGEVAEISSIGQDGRVIFKGGQGYGAWPDLISVIARASENSDSAKEARRQAENSAARRRARSEWSLAKEYDLSEFRTEVDLSEGAIEELETVIARADDERPIQEFLGENRHLLTALLEGVDRYCLPQKRLGGEYIPDFIIGDVNSLGIRWVLVELETPRSGIYLKDGLRFDQKARRGVEQVIEWRNWLSDNIAYARRKRSENGLGLFDIREKPEALVLVGRRARIPITKDAQRHEYRESNGIRVHTYDWLLKTLRGIFKYQGPPASNSYLIHRLD